MSLESLLQDMIEAIHANTAALVNGKSTPIETAVEGKPETTKPETAKQKKVAKEKKAAKAANGDRITVESVKALAKKIALASDDPKECMIQIREAVGITAEACYDDASKGIDQFDEDGLSLLKGVLNDFEYTPIGDRKNEADDLEI